MTLVVASLRAPERGDEVSVPRGVGLGRRLPARCTMRRPLSWLGPSRCVFFICQAWTAAHQARRWRLRGGCSHPPSDDAMRNTDTSRGRSRWAGVCSVLARQLRAPPSSLSYVDQSAPGAELRAASCDAAAAVGGQHGQVRAPAEDVSRATLCNLCTSGPRTAQFKATRTRAVFCLYILVDGQCYNGIPREI